MCITRFLSIPILVTAVAGMCVGAAASHADVISVKYTQVGGFFGPPAPGDEPLMPDNLPGFQNYFVGQTVLPHGIVLPERRAFFAFDLSDVVIPIGHEVVGVSMSTELVFGGVSANFSGGHEVVGFTSTPVPFGVIVDPAGAGVDPLDIFMEFGVGEMFGMVEFLEDGPPPGEIEVDFSPPGMAMVAGMIGSPEAFVVTSRLLTFDPAPGEIVSEFAYGFTDLVKFGDETDFPPVYLKIMTAPVPAPAAPALLGAAVLFGGGRRRR